MKEIEQMDFDRAIYAHSGKAQPLLGGTKQDVRDYIQFLQDIRGAIYAEFQKGTNWMKIPHAVKLPRYKGLVDVRRMVADERWAHSAG